MTVPKFDRCVRVNNRDVFIVKGKQRVHVESYDELREKWGDPPVEDVSEGEVADFKVVEEFKTRKKKVEPKPVKAEPEPVEEEATEEPDVREPEEV